VDALSVLAAFGSTGRAGMLFPGARLREVAAAYGMPWDIGRIHRRRRWPHLYSYGDVEFVVCRCRIITAVAVQTWRETMTWPPPTKPGQNITLPARPTFAQMVEALAAVDCQWERLEPSAGQCTLRTLPQQVDFTFATDEGTEPVLHAASTWSQNHDCIPATDVAKAYPDDFPAEQMCRPSH